jgi:hypothetical protein
MMSDEPSDAELRAASSGSERVQRDELDDRRNLRHADRYAVRWDTDRKPPKPKLPEPPDHLDLNSQCMWTTSVMHLDTEHPVARAVHQGLSGAAGHVVLHRLDAPEIRFEPAAKISSAQKLADELVWQLLPTDGDPYPWSNAQATIIARVVWLLCGATKTATTSQETEHIIATFLEASRLQEGHTYGNARQRAEFARLLRPSEGVRIHGRDLDTGEYIVRVSDLQRARRADGGLGMGPHASRRPRATCHFWAPGRAHPRRRLSGASPR